MFFKIKGRKIGRYPFSLVLSSPIAVLRSEIEFYSGRLISRRVWHMSACGFLLLAIAHCLQAVEYLGLAVRISQAPLRRGAKTRFLRDWYRRKVSRRSA